MPHYEPVPVPEGSERETDPMHVALQEHIAGCEQCQVAVETSGRRTPGKEFGSRTRMCQEYLGIVMRFAGGGQ